MTHISPWGESFWLNKASAKMYMTKYSNRTTVNQFPFLSLPNELTSNRLNITKYNNINITVGMICTINFLRIIPVIVCLSQILPAL